MTPHRRRPAELPPRDRAPRASPASPPPDSHPLGNEPAARGRHRPRHGCRGAPEPRAPCGASREAALVRAGGEVLAACASRLQAERQLGTQKGGARAPGRRPGGLGPHEQRAAGQSGPLPHLLHEVRDTPRHQPRLPGGPGRVGAPAPRRRGWGTLSSLRGQHETHRIYVSPSLMTLFKLPLIYH